MLLLLFEVTPREGHVDEYLAIAAKLRPELDAMGGCLFIDRYRSRARHVLAFDAVQPVPTLAALPGAKRLRVGEIERDYGMHDRAEAPQYYAPVSHSPRQSS